MPARTYSSSAVMLSASSHTEQLLKRKLRSASLAEKLMYIKLVRRGYTTGYTARSTCVFLDSFIPIYDCVTVLR